MRSREVPPRRGNCDRRAIEGCDWNRFICRASTGLRQQLIFIATRNQRNTRRAQQAKEIAANHDQLHAYIAQSQNLIEQALPMAKRHRKEVEDDYLSEVTASIATPYGSVKFLAVTHWPVFSPWTLLPLSYLRLHPAVHQTSSWRRLPRLLLTRQ